MKSISRKLAGGALALGLVVGGTLLGAAPAMAGGGGSGTGSCSSNEYCMVTSYTNARWVEHRTGLTVGGGALVDAWDNNTGSYANHTSNYGAGSHSWNVFAEITPSSMYSWCNCFTSAC